MTNFMLEVPLASVPVLHVMVECSCLLNSSLPLEVDRSACRRDVLGDVRSWDQDFSCRHAVVGHLINNSLTPCCRSAKHMSP